MTANLFERENAILR